MPADKSLPPEDVAEMARAMTPEISLDSWREWNIALCSRPVILGPLSGGRSNRSFLLDSDGSRMVLRLNGPDSLLPGAKRSSEIRIWKAASKQGLAPPLLHADRQNRFLVSTYIRNDLPTEPQHTGAYVDQALKLLDRCHQLEVDAPLIDYRSHLERYLQIIEKRQQTAGTDLIKQQEPMNATLTSLINSNPQTGLCHHDPVTANFVGSPERLYLVDWEYAAKGLLAMDYAAFATEWKLDNEIILARTHISGESLAAAKTLYQYLCELWEETG
jgi:thiamine kinase